MPSKNGEITEAVEWLRRQPGVQVRLTGKNHYFVIPTGSRPFTIPSTPTGNGWKDDLARKCRKAGLDIASRAPIGPDVPTGRAARRLARRRGVTLPPEPSQEAADLLADPSPTNSPSLDPEPTQESPVSAQPVALPLTVVSRTRHSEHVDLIELSDAARTVTYGCRDCDFRSDNINSFNGHGGAHPERKVRAVKVPAARKVVSEVPAIIPNGPGKGRPMRETTEITYDDKTTEYRCGVGGCEFRAASLAAINGHKGREHKRKDRLSVVPEPVAVEPVQEPVEAPEPVVEAAPVVEAPQEPTQTPVQAARDRVRHASVLLAEAASALRDVAVDTGEADVLRDRLATVTASLEAAEKRAEDAESEARSLRVALESEREKREIAEKALQQIRALIPGAAA